MSGATVTAQRTLLAQRLSISLSIAGISAIGISFSLVAFFGVGLWSTEKQATVPIPTQQERVVKLTDSLSQLNVSYRSASGEARAMVLRDMQVVADERLEHLTELASISPGFVEAHAISGSTRDGFPVEVQPLLEVQRTIEGTVQAQPARPSPLLLSPVGTFALRGDASTISSLQEGEFVRVTGILLGDTVLVQSVSESVLPE